jgi:hypothetical protein
MSWFRRSQESAEDAGTPARQDQSNVDPETAARRRSRLERRITNLEYDITLALSTRQPDNRWNRRVQEIEQAIKQAQSEFEQLAQAPEPDAPIALPATPVTSIELEADMPATVQFRIGDVAFRYSEEVDWSERGEQRAQPGLRRFEGDPAQLAPADVPDERRAALAEHLRHSLGALAISLRDTALEGSEPPSLTLAELAHPCPVCGGWRDLRERCIACQRREWDAAAVRDEIQRLMDERNHLMDEIAKQREALPVLQRQLADARAELDKYRNRD